LPGNIRELENLIERIVVLFPGDKLVDRVDIPLEVLMNSAQDVQDSESPKAGLIKLREAFEKRIILNVLEASQWNQSEAAKILKVNRNTLIQKAKQFGILIRNSRAKLLSFL